MEPVTINAADVLGQVQEQQTEPIKVEQNTLHSKDRLTCVLTVTHQSHGSDHKVCDIRFADSLESKDEEMLIRPMKIDKDWKPLETHWLDGKVGYIVLENRVGKEIQARPTQEEREFMKGQIIEVIHKDMVGMKGIIRPNRVLGPIEFENVQDLVVRCVQGTAKLRIHIFPK
jgi:hypothetical protein